MDHTEMREDPLEHRKLEGERGEGGDSLSQNTATARSLPRSRQIACSPPSLQPIRYTHTSLPSAMRQVAQRTRATARYASNTPVARTPCPIHAALRSTRATLQTERRHVLNSHTVDSQSMRCSHTRLRHRLSTEHSLPVDSRPGMLSTRRTLTSHGRVARPGTQASTHTRSSCR